MTDENYAQEPPAHLAWPSAFKDDIHDMFARELGSQVIIKHAFKKYALVLYEKHIAEYRSEYRKRLLDRRKAGYQPNRPQPKPHVALKPVAVEPPPGPVLSIYKPSWPREDQPTTLTAQSDQCRWIEADFPKGDGDAAKCCGAKTYKETKFCKAHYRVVYPKMTAQQRKDMWAHVGKGLWRKGDKQ